MVASGLLLARVLLMLYMASGRADEQDIRASLSLYIKMLGVPQRMLRAIESELSVCRKELVYLQSEEAGDSDDARKLRKILFDIMYSAEGDNVEDAILKLNQPALNSLEIKQQVKQGVSALLERIVKSVHDKFISHSIDQAYYIKFVCAVCGFVWQQFRFPIRGLFVTDHSPFPVQMRTDPVCNDPCMQMALTRNIQKENDVIRLAMLDRPWRDGDFRPEPAVEEVAKRPAGLVVGQEVISWFRKAWGRLFEYGGIMMPALANNSTRVVKLWLGTIISNSRLIESIGRPADVNDEFGMQIYQTREAYLLAKTLLINVSKVFMRFCSSRIADDVEREVIKNLRFVYDEMGCIPEPRRSKSIRVGRGAGGKQDRP